ncbi:7614_t:CDS:2, partial [Entrophospora sp. SA101]
NTSGLKTWTDGVGFLNNVMNYLIVCNEGARLGAPQKKCIDDDIKMQAAWLHYRVHWLSEVDHFDLSKDCIDMPNFVWLYEGSSQI